MPEEIESPIPEESESPSFESELQALIEKHTLDIEYTIPSSILAHYLEDFLCTFGETVHDIREWPRDLPSM